MKKPNDLFGRLPTVSDLMENPRIKALVDRIQEMEVAEGVNHYVQRLRREISRRTIDYPIPSIAELADRAARFILGRQASSHRQVINATGQLWPSAVVGPPLADEAVTAMSAQAQHTHQTDDMATAKLAAELAGAQAARLYTSQATAMLAALAAVAGPRRVLVARAEMGTLEANLRLADLAHQAGVELVEVGASDSVGLDDYKVGLEQQIGMLLRIESLPHAVRGHIARPSLSELASLATTFSIPLVHHIGRGPLLPLPWPIEVQVGDASSSLDAGATLVVARGDGYLGGPRCGLVLGNREAIAKLDTPLSRLLTCDSLIETALHTTLAMWNMPDQAALSIPTLAMLSAPVMNLESRANRIAAQLAQLPEIATATAIEVEPASDLGGNRLLPSFAVNVLCQPGQREQLAERIRSADPCVLANWNDDRVLLDLRTVAPSDDIALVAAFESEPMDPPTDE